MSDIFGISSAAVSTYQGALSTVSNNIANVGTEGYVRQESKLVENPAALNGKIYLGTGSRFAGVQRAYDQFLESNVRSSNSDLSTQGPLLTYTNRIVDILGSDTVGLPPAMDKFFSSARSLSTDPSSTILRSQFVRDSQGLSDRFNQLSGQLDSVDTETREAINGKVDQINNLSNQIVLVNKQLAGKPTADLQPPELLDQRDRLLNSLSKLVKINVTTQTNGAVNVGIGTVKSSGLIVDGQNSLQIGAKFDMTDLGRFTIVADPYGNAEPIIGVGSGELGGLVSFREQVLQPTVAQLDFLAQTVAKEVNTVQAGGIDIHGNLGKDLFTISQVAKTDPVSGQTTQVDHAAAGISVAISDPTLLATGAMFRAIPNENNVSGVSTSLTYAASYVDSTQVKPLSTVLTNNPDPTAGISPPNNQLLGQIPQGSNNWSLYMDNASGDQQIQVFTRDGRQLLGSPMKDDPNDPNYNLLSSIMKKENGFVPGSTYSKDYLNQSGDAGYKQINLFYGLKAEPSTHYAANAQFDSAHAVLPSSTFKQVTTGKSIPADLKLIPAGALSINGKLLPALKPQSAAATDSISAADMAAWLNRTTTNMTPAVHATALTEFRVATNSIDLGKRLTINGQEVWKGSADPSADANNDGMVDTSDLVDAINNPPNPTGVTASIDQTTGALVLQDQNGNDLKIAAPDGDTGNALTLDPQTLKGSLTISSEGSVTLGYGPKGKITDLDPTTSPLGEPVGQYFVSVLPVVPLDASIAGNRIPSNVRSIAGGAISLNGLALTGLPDTGKDLSASDIASWMNAQSSVQLTPPVTATASNKISVPSYLMNLSLSLKINGTSVWNGNGSAKPEDLVAAINAAGAGVDASLDIAGNVILSNQTGDDISLGATGSHNALGFSNGNYKGSLSLSSPGEIKIGFNGNGTPADLAKLGLRTGVYVDGPTPEDLLVFVTGQGNGTLAGSYDSSMQDPSNLNAARIDSLRAEKLEVTFTTDKHYQISWTNPANNLKTVLAEREYDPQVGINYQGLQLQLSAAPVKGDQFQIDGNQDGIGNNENILKLADLEKKTVIGGPTGSTMAQSYEEQLNRVGNISSQAKVAQDALTVVNKQAIESKDKVSGVSLDSEAADLIRYQQAYQASAKAMQVASQLFDAILQGA